MAVELRWSASDVLEVDGVRFLVTQDPQRMYDEPPAECQFILLKDQTILDGLQQATAGTTVARVMEFGIFKGGSVALNHKLFRPEKLVAAELSQEPPAALARYIGAANLDAVIKPYYGVDQGTERPSSSCWSANSRSATLTW